MSIRIATNSPCDIPLNEARQIGVDIVPLKIVFDGKEYRGCGYGHKGVLYSS